MTGSELLKISHFLRRCHLKPDGYGIVYGVGVGPGEPGLITVKALSVIREADVIVIPSSPPDSCRAYCIVQAVMPEIAQKELLALDFPMGGGKEARERYHKEAAERLAVLSGQGKNSAFLVIGDPSIYSTFTYVAGILDEMGIPTKSVCGTASFLAAASALGIPLVEKDEMLHVLPGSADVEEGLKLPGTKVFMKNKSSFPRLLSLLREEESAGHIFVKAVSACGMPDETLYESASEIPEHAPYLTIVIVKDRFTE